MHRLVGAKKIRDKLTAQKKQQAQSLRGVKTVGKDKQNTSSSHFSKDPSNNSEQGDLFPQQRERTWSIPKEEFVARPYGHLWRVGVFIDVQNLYLCVKSVFNQAKINYRALKDFLSHNGTVVNMTAFTCYDPDNHSQLEFIHALALMGYRVVAKPIKRLPDGSVKASMDMEMAIEILSEAPYLDEIIIVTGDGDFAPLVDQLARMGKVVKVIGPDKLTSPELIRSCNAFINLTQIDGILDI